MLILFLLILINGIFSMAEIAIISSKKARLKERAKRGDKGAITALELADSPGRFLSTIQIGITTVGIVMGAFSGSSLAQKISPIFKKFSITAEDSNTISLWLVIAFVSYLTLIFGELVPKKLALYRADFIAQLISRPMKYLSILTAPLVIILTKSIDTVMFVLHQHESKEPEVTYEDITHAVDIARIEGLFGPDEQKIVRRVLDFGERQAHSLMTPRTHVIWLDINDSVSVIISKIVENPYSRFPVIDESPDNIIGVLNARDLLQYVDNPISKINHLIQEPLFIAEHLTAIDVLQLFKIHPIHFAIVIDEYGGFRGIITPYDFLQALVGELPFEQEPTIPGIKKIRDNQWILDGAIPIQEFKLLFNIDKIPGEHKYGTLSGFVMQALGHIPIVGECFKWNNLDFSVESIKENKILTIKVCNVEKINL